MSSSLHFSYRPSQYEPLSITSFGQKALSCLERRRGIPSRFKKNTCFLLALVHNQAGRSANPCGRMSSKRAGFNEPLCSHFRSNATPTCRNPPFPVKANWNSCHRGRHKQGVKTNFHALSYLSLCCHAYTFFILRQAAPKIS